MKFVYRPQRRSAAREETRLALFPFLAVLICTMGVLIPMLTVISRIVKGQAEAAAAAKAAEQTADVQTQLEDARWRIEMLRESRAKTEAQLADARLELGHLEDHQRRLREELERRRRTLDALDGPRPADRRVGEIEAELQRVRGEIEAAAGRLEVARKQAAAKKPTYAIIPYEGPNQTFRRPIYVECRADAVVLQPEGIVLADSDFDGPLGPGNPLAAALRAAREYMLEQGGYDAKSGEPYPLLLVRPDGIPAYYAAREALTSWGPDFGYELIGGDWTLAFPPPDERLEQVVRRSIATARMEQARLAAAAPTHRGVQGRVVYRAAPGGGGFIREEAPPGLDANDYRPVSPSGPVATRNDGGRGAGDGGRGTGDGGRGTDTIQRPATGDATSTENRPATGDASDTTIKRPATAGAGVESGDSTGLPPSGNAAESNPLRESNAGGGDFGSQYASTGGDRASGARPEGYVVGQPPREQDASGKSPAAAGSRALRPGEWEPAANQPAGGSEAAGAAGPGDNNSDAPPAAKSLAAERGKDWGLRNTSSSSVGIRRPIGVVCYPDRIIILSERDPGSNKVVPLGANVESSIDAVISAVWERIESWGMAGRSMYWRPVLKVAVAPGGQARFAELAALLDGSGLEVERKKWRVESGE